MPERRAASTGRGRAKRPHVPVEQRRRELTEVALRVMVRDGAQGLTTRAVAKEAGVPLGSVHYAFSSKAELVACVVQEDLGYLHEIIDLDAARAVDTRAGVAAHLADLAARYGRTVLDDPLRELAFFELSLMAVREPALEEINARAHRDHRDLFASLLEALVEGTDLAWPTRTPVLAETVVGQIYGLTTNWFAHRDDALFLAALADAADAVEARLTARD